jgi:hypothetical protein
MPDQTESTLDPVRGGALGRGRDGAEADHAAFSLATRHGTELGCRGQVRSVPPGGFGGRLLPNLVACSTIVAASGRGTVLALCKAETR